MAIKLIGPKYPKDKSAINVTSCSTDWGINLSPMLLGPVQVPNFGKAGCVENAWQYSKVYPNQITKSGDPSIHWKMWAQKGFNSTRGQRYPMGKGAIPQYSFWNGQKLDYISARKQIYIPIYKNAAISSGWFDKLQDLYYSNGNNITIWDFDGYDYEKEGITLNQVINDSNRVMGHGHVLAMMLEGLI